ncbi:MAG: bifunctional response regulator/alkaline phosphatase family protein [Candidatus Caldipriscus sp.]|jgi:CheY-like chemotaxis protein|nr:bifunctional response regulator/alkaline phosphatase family protein [Candidatus Caldipriscus sp.]
MRILWIDDEIDELGSVIAFLRSQGVDVDTAKSAIEGVEKLSRNTYNLVLLDYRMPGVSGLEALRLIKQSYPNLPVVMLTMITDEEVIKRSFVEDAYDYIVKPVQPAQILALLSKLKRTSIKKDVFLEEAEKLREELSEIPETFEGWLLKAIKIFQARIRYRAYRSKFDEILEEENVKFSEWVSRFYPEIIRDSTILMSHNLLKKMVLPYLEVAPVALFVLDNFRFDQLYEVVSEISTFYKVEQFVYMSILPSVTQFSRNALFAGKLPDEMERMMEGVLQDNQNELKMLWKLLEEERYKVKTWYTKIKNLESLSEIEPVGKRFEIYVVNFVDTILHISSSLEQLKALGEGESSVKRWARLVLEDGRFAKVIERFLEEGYWVFITSDHGWVIGREPMRVFGEELAKGFRYKHGRGIRVEGRKFLMVEKPKEWGLPDWGQFLFATEDGFFVWGERMDEYAEIYKNRMFHGGISLEEMVLSLIRVQP